MQHMTHDIWHLTPDMGHMFKKKCFSCPSLPVFIVAQWWARIFEYLNIWIKWPSNIIRIHIRVISSVRIYSDIYLYLEETLLRHLKKMLYQWWVQIFEYSNNMTLKYYLYSCYLRNTNIFRYSFSKYVASEYISTFIW